MSTQDIFGTIRKAFARTGEAESLILGKLSKLADDRALAFKDGPVTYVVASPGFWAGVDTRMNPSPNEPAHAFPIMGVKIHDLDRDTSAFEPIMAALATALRDRGL